MRFAVRVKPNARRTAVGGRWAGPSGPPGPGGTALVVSVTAPALDGKANAAVIHALATAFEVRRSGLRIVSGERGRDKVVELDPAPPGAAARLAELLAGPTR